MEIIAFIAARGGSKSIPLKNIKEFCGKPLIYWNLEALEKVNEINKIYVATDSNIIKNTVVDFGFPKVEIYDRDPENAQDHSSTESVMLEFIEKIEVSDSDIFLLVNATCPLTQSDDFKNALEFYLKNKFDSLLTCARMKRFFWNENGSPINYDYKSRPRRQDFEGILMENGAFYINTVENIKKYKNRLSGKIAIYEMPEYASVDIDEPDDWLYTESVMQRYVLSQRVKKQKIKLFATDVDGVLTDAGMYYSEHGDELKKFNTRDGKGIELLRKNGIKTALITSEKTKIVERRSKKLKFDYVFQGVSDKINVINQLCKELKVSINEVAYIGDDLNDVELLKKVGYSACPNDALQIVKSVSNYNCKLSGGYGCVREFIDEIILKI